MEESHSRREANFIQQTEGQTWEHQWTACSHLGIVWKKFESKIHIPDSSDMLEAIGVKVSDAVKAFKIGVFNSFQSLTLQQKKYMYDPKYSQLPKKASLYYPR